MAQRGPAPTVVATGPRHGGNAAAVAKASYASAKAKPPADFNAAFPGLQPIQTNVTAKKQGTKIKGAPVNPFAYTAAAK